MRALQRESQFLLGEGQVIVRLDRVVGSGQVLVWSLAEVASVWVLGHRTGAREWIAVVGVHAGHADIEHIIVSLLLHLRAQSCRYRSMRSIVVRNTPIASLRWLPAQDGPVPLRRLPTQNMATPLRRLPAQNMATPLRRLPLDSTLALLGQFSLHRTSALL